jgi:peroxiredoxin
MSTALRSVGRLDVLSSTPAAPSGRAPCIHARLHRLATKAGEKSGLARVGSGVRARKERLVDSDLTSRVFPLAGWMRRPTAASIEPSARSRAGTFACILCFGLSLASANGQIGAKVAGFRLTDAAGRTHALEDYAGKILVLEFWSFKCPPASAYEGRVSALQAKYAPRGVIFLAVSSNKNESVAEVRLNSANRKLPYPVLMDLDGAVAESVGATHTPGVVILNGSGIVCYRGAIDNNKRPGERGRIPYVEDALDALLAGKAVPQTETAMSGCTIKR